MGLTKFVRNVKDLSDDGGYKFRFHCDKCGDGFESQYVAASTNMLKTAVDVFSMLKPLGGYGAKRVADSIDRGLRGKERDKAYEKAAHRAMHFFKKCNGCGKWVCPQSCWNQDIGMCEACAPNTNEEKLKQLAQKQVDQALRNVQESQQVGVRSLACLVCNQSVSGGKFCEHCGSSLEQSRDCHGCGQQLKASAKFCTECGAKAS